MFYFHKVAYVHYLGEMDIFSYVSKKFLPLYNSAKIIKIDRDFPKLWSQMYCHLFYGSQCILLQACCWCWFSSPFHVWLFATVEIHNIDMERIGSVLWLLMEDYD